MSSDDAELRSALTENSDALLGYFERRVNQPADAADLFGETMLQAWRRAKDAPESEEAVRAWLYGIARNVLSNHRRSLGRRQNLTERLRNQLTEAAPDPAERTAVQQAVDRLKPAQRELVMLIHWDGFNINEAAEIMGLNASTARSRYAKAREELRQALMEQPQQVPTVQPA